MSVGVMEDYKLTDLRSSHTGIKSSLFAAENGIAFFFSFFFFLSSICVFMAGKEVQGGAPKEAAACPYTYKVQSFPPLPASWCARVSKRSTRGSRIAVGFCEPSIMMRTPQGH
jgi:hypothetical protein